MSRGGRRHISDALRRVLSSWLCSHHRIIMKFSGVITKDQGNVHAKGQGQRSKFKVTEVTTQFNRFRTVTPVWIHIWWWNDTYSLMLHRRGLHLFCKVIHQISRSLKIVEFDPYWAFPDCNSSLNSPMAMKWCTKLEVAYKRWPIVFQCDPSNFKVTRLYEMLHKAWSSIEEVPYCFARSSVKFQRRTALKIVEFDPDWAFPDCNSSLNSPMGTKCCTKLEVA